MSGLVDNRNDPPRMSGWGTAYAVVSTVVAVAVVIATVPAGRWFTAAAFTVLGATTVGQYVQRRRRHQEALAAFRPPSGPDQGSSKV